MANLSLFGFDESGSMVRVRHRLALDLTPTEPVTDAELSAVRLALGIGASGSSISGKGSVNALDYGAKGDYDAESGTGTDDTDALQAAINDAKTKGVRLYIPATSRAYKISAALVGDNNVEISGDGWASKIIQTGSDCNVLNFDGKSNFRVSRVHLKAKGDFTLSTPDYGARYCALWMRNCTDGVVDSCIFSGYAYSGVFNLCSDRTRILNSTFTSPAYIDPYAIQQQTGDIAIMDSQNCLAENNWCYSPTGYCGAVGIGIDGGIREMQGQAPKDSVNNVIRNNFIKRKSLYGIMSYNHVLTLNGGLRGTVIEGNQIEDIDGSYHHVTEGTAYSGITQGTAAGTAIYAQTSYETIIRENRIYRCGKYTRAHGTLLKAAITASGTPDNKVEGNYIKDCYFNGVAMNDSQGTGDLANRTPHISCNDIVETGAWINTGTMASGSTQLTLTDQTSPLETAQAAIASGGFFVGDKIKVMGAGAGGAPLETTITAMVSPGVFTLQDAAITTINGNEVTLSELSTSPPSARALINVAIVQKPLIENNVVTRTNNGTGGTIAVYVRGIRVIGAGGGASAMLLPRVTGNWIKGGYIGIEVINASSADITDNTIYAIFTDSISANSNTIRVNISANRCFSATTGIRVNSLNGLVANNYCESCATGIHSTQAVLRNNQTPACTVQYGNELPGIRTVNANYTAIEADETFLVNTTLGGVTITLPEVAKFPGKLYEFSVIAGANNLIVDGNAAELIDGAATKSTTGKLRIKSDGAAWYSI